MVQSFSIIIILFLIILINSNQNISNSEINLLAKKVGDDKKLIYLSSKNNKLEVSGNVPFSILVTICDFNNIAELSYTYNNSKSRYKIPYKKNKTIEFQNWNLYSKYSMNSISIHYAKSNQLYEFYGAEIIYSFTYIDKQKINQINQLKLSIKSNNSFIYWEPIISKGNVTYELYIIQNNKTFLNNSCYLNFLKTKYKKNNTKNDLNSDEENIEYYDLKQTNFTMKTKGQFFIQIVAHVEEEDILYRMKYNAISKEIYYESYNWFYFTLPLVFFGLLFLMIVLLNQKGSDNNYVPLDKNLNNEFISNIIDKSDSNNIK